jgi:hypothetical protein
MKWSVLAPQIFTIKLQLLKLSWIVWFNRYFNGMLDRLETSFEIQANFINNASHELKPQ